MSLDIYLKVNEEIEIKNSSGIFIRENGSTIEISREEWDKRYPDREPVVFNREDTTTNIVYHTNITHNLGTMASIAGIYEVLWKPEEIGIDKAEQLIPILKIGLEQLKRNPEEYKKYNPSNGWGNYEGFCIFIENYIIACETYPEATIEISR